MIYIKDDGPINIQNNKPIINYNLLRKQTGDEDDGKLVDRKLKEVKDDDGNDIRDEYKPLWIIDGQHRIIGSIEQDENLMRIPLVIFKKNFGQMDR